MTTKVCKEDFRAKGWDMERLLLAMTALVCLIMMGVMTRMTFDGHRGTSPTDMDEIKKLLAKFDELEAQPEPRVDGSGGFHNRSGDTIIADGVRPADEWPPRLM
jgi:hypothetical protein